MKSLIKTIIVFRKSLQRSAPERSEDSARSDVLLIKKTDQDGGGMGGDGQVYILPCPPPIPCQYGVHGVKNIHRLEQ